jgi:hypothetical protein
MPAIISWMRVWGLAIAGLLLVAGGDIRAQTSLVEVPEQAPHGYLFQAGGGNIAFNESQAAPISGELRKFSKETGFPVYLVTVNSPPKEVLASLQQQIDGKWKNDRDCLVIFYDLDKRMLAVDFEHFRRGPDGMMLPSRLLGISENAWVKHVDEWLKNHNQSDGLEINMTHSFFHDFLNFMRQEFNEAKKAKPVSHAWLIGIVLGVLLAFGIYVSLLKFTRKFTADVEYHFPMLRMQHRLKARFGGGLLSVRQIGSYRAPK